MEEEEEEHEEQDYEQEEAEEVCNMKKTDHEKREGEEEGSLARSLYSKNIYIYYVQIIFLSLSLSRMCSFVPTIMCWVFVLERRCRAFLPPPSPV